MAVTYADLAPERGKKGSDICRVGNKKVARSGATQICDIGIIAVNAYVRSACAMASPVANAPGGSNDTPKPATMRVQLSITMVR